jgi:hypothetical protein
MSQEEEGKAAGEAAETPAATPPAKTPSLFRNYVSFAGAAVAAAAFVSITLMIMMEFVGGEAEGHNPYTGIFTYVLFPSVLVFGLFLILLGMLWERRRRRRMSPDEIGRYPVLDLNDPRRRRTFVVFLLLAFVFLFMSAFGSYRAFEHSESVQFCGQTCHTVMKPEFVAYQASPHARVKCVECHVGGGAEWYVRAKFNGAYQLYSVAFDKYSRPIKSPVHNMRPARDTCAQCHWPEKFLGTRLKTLAYYGYDERNSPRQVRLLLNVGGGTPGSGPVSGIHWHMNLGNEVTYIATDERRQVIPWVRFKDSQGNVTEYFARGAQLTPAQIESAEKRRVDCIDCHNRPAHVYLPPDKAVNDSLAAGRIDPALPFVKRQAVEALSAQYSTEDEAVAAIGRDLEGFYRQNHPEVYAARGEAVRAAVAEVQRIYRTYFFPEMKTDWKAHPDNISHYYSQGCFRCHDGQHVSNTGKVIRNECNVCHTVLDQFEAGRPVALQDGKFQHPVNLGDLAGTNCTACHKHTRAFQHPVNLGDLSQFKCVDCHAGKNWTLEGD